MTHTEAQLRAIAEHIVKPVGIGQEKSNWLCARFDFSIPGIFGQVCGQYTKPWMRRSAEAGKLPLRIRRQVKGLDTGEFAQLV